MPGLLCFIAEVRLGRQLRCAARGVELDLYTRGNENFVLVVDAESHVRVKNLVIG
jgi:hypothetical protein